MIKLAKYFLAISTLIALPLLSAPADAQMSDQRKKEWGQHIKNQERKQRFNEQMNQPTSIHEGIIGQPSSAPQPSFPQASSIGLIPALPQLESSISGETASPEGAAGGESVRVATLLTYDDAAARQSVEICLTNGLPEVLSRTVQFVEPTSPFDLHIASNIISSFHFDGRRTGFIASTTTHVMGSANAPHLNIASSAESEVGTYICKEILESVRNRMEAETFTGVRVLPDRGTVSALVSVHAEDQETTDKLMQCLAERVVALFRDGLETELRWAESYDDADVALEVFTYLAKGDNGRELSRTGAVGVSMPRSNLPPKSSAFVAPPTVGSFEGLCLHSSAMLAFRIADEMEFGAGASFIPISKNRLVFTGAIAPTTE